MCASGVSELLSQSLVTQHRCVVGAETRCPRITVPKGHQKYPLSLHPPPHGKVELKEERLAHLFPQREPEIGFLLGDPQSSDEVSVGFPRVYAIRPKIHPFLMSMNIVIYLHYTYIRVYMYTYYIHAYTRISRPPSCEKYL